MALVNTVMNELEGTIKRYKYVGSFATVSVSIKTLFLILCYETPALLNCVLRGINNGIPVIDLTN
jgi:hypothetical protein